MDMSSVLPVMPTSGGGGMFGGSGGSSDWIVFLIIAIIFGWGNGGLGGKNGVATTDNAIANEFNFNSLNNGVRAIETGICDLGFALSQDNGRTRDAITANAFSTERGFNTLASQLASCCCDTQKELLVNRYDMAKGFCDVVNNASSNTRDIINAGNMNTQRIVDMMTSNQLQELRDKNNALTIQVSQQNQTATILNSLKPTPRPSYIVPNPCCPTV